MCDAMEDYKSIFENKLAELKERQDRVILEAVYYFQALSEIHTERCEIKNKLFYLNREEEKNARNSKKQYLIILDDEMIGKFTALISGLKFIEVQAMGLKDSPNFQAVVIPAPVVPVEEKPSDNQ